MKRNAVQQQAPARKAQKHSKSETVTSCIRSCAEAKLPRQSYQGNATKTARGGPAITRRGKAAMAMVKRPAKSASRKSTSQKPAAKSVMLPTDRLAYSPITDRPPLKLPNGARMAVWVVINVEEWDATQAMPRTVITPPAGGAPMPDVPNWAWHEYGNRVGFWRFVEIFDAFAIPGVLAINGSALAAYPQIVRAAVERNWEFMGHGFTQRNLQKVADERADIRKVREVIAKAAGKRPRGWLGPGLTETWQTPDVLAEEGYDYVADWVLDDQPVWLKTRGRPILNLPYTQECNDVAMMLIQHHKASEYCERALDQFEQIYADSATSARIMALSMHPYIMGAPHRVKYLRRIFEVIRKKSDVLFWTGAQIADWFVAAGPKAP
jgi:peptidoglycan/xylan/chitin deacetylase (PgdA/CDA1 family)